MPLVDSKRRRLGGSVDDDAESDTEFDRELYEDRQLYSFLLKVQMTCV